MTGHELTILQDGDFDRRAAELQLDACLAEALGQGPPASLAQRLAARLRAEQATEATQSRRRRLWAAALLLGGAGVVAAVTVLRERPAGRQAATPEPQQEPAPDRGQDPQAPDAEQKRIEQLLRDLELAERRDTALAALTAIGSPAIPAIDRALAGEAARRRPDVLDALRTARARCGVAAAKAAFGLPAEPVTLIADYSDNEVVAVDASGRVVWSHDEIFGAWDVELTPAGTMLITQFSVSKVIEVDRTGRVLWSYDDLKNPYDADRLPDGNTLIANTFGSEVVEVTPDGKVAWKFGGVRPFDAERLANGNTLISDVLKDRVIEVSPAGEIVWEAKDMNNVHDADRLPNGNTLITLRSSNSVIEVDRDGKVVWELGNLSSPSDADRLPNGNTLVAENTQVREFDRNGNVVWRREATWAVECGRY